MLSDSLKSFEILAEMRFPLLFLDCTKEWQQVEVFRETAEYILAKPMSVEQVISEILNGNWETFLLYDFCRSLDTDYDRKISFYSYPTENHMFILSAQAEPSGDVKRINVCIYKSIDDMYFDVLRQIKYINESSGIKRYERNEMQITCDFLF